MCKTDKPDALTRMLERIDKVYAHGMCDNGAREVVWYRHKATPALVRMVEVMLPALDECMEADVLAAVNAIAKEVLGENDDEGTR